jgi:diadenosine tetraphosphate (Ap4A) HIT family hydrolase
MSDCVMCRGAAGDPELMREEVWRDELWRLTTAVEGEVAGFSYLEPLRHVRYIEELDGPEAATLGTVLARCSAAIKQACNAERVYVYVFGGSVPHLHLHLAPHVTGGPMNEALIKGELTEQTLPSGATLFFSKDYPPLQVDELREAVDGVRALLA